MKDHPLLKAAMAEGYIVTLGLCAVYVLPLLEGLVHPVFGIVAFLSTFVFSAASMGYFFISAPLLLALAGKSQEAVAYFLRTLLYFALITAVALSLLYILHI